MFTLNQVLVRKMYDVGTSLSGVTFVSNAILPQLHVTTRPPTRIVLGKYHDA